MSFCVMSDAHSFIVEVQVLLQHVLTLVFVLVQGTQASVEARLRMARKFSS